MKYVLILYLCSFLNEPQCFNSNIVGVEFNNYYDCITEGYKYSYSRLKEIPIDEIEKNKLAIRFACQEVPKIET